MALALKYRLLCGSVVITPRFWYHEWYYSLLQAGVHYFEVDPAWTNVEDVLHALRSNAASAEAVAAAARNMALRYLTEDAMDCYWRYLIELTHRHFPPPVLERGAIPLEHAMLANTAVAAFVHGQADMPTYDVIIVIPTRAADYALMDLARRTWLRDLDSDAPYFSHRHFFVLSREDPDLTEQIASAAGNTEVNDMLLVNCPHGYTWLLQKMALAYRELLASFNVHFFIRADVDSVLPLKLLLPLLPISAHRQAVVQVASASSTGCGPVSAARWRSHQMFGHLSCQTECAVDRVCIFFTVDRNTGACATFGASCRSVLIDATARSAPEEFSAVKTKRVQERVSSHGTPLYDVYEYRLRVALQESQSSVEAPVPDWPSGTSSSSS